MQRVILLTALSCLVTVTPGRAQNQDSMPAPRRNEITIPSERTLERDAVASSRNDFSKDDSTATRQMERQNQQIDRKIMKGICTGC